MAENPEASRPYMPGYGTLGPHEGGGLLRWSWAEQRLASSHDYWLSTVRPDGRPHLMPVWGVWLDGALWFSSSLSSRKARNLARDPRCSVATDDAFEPVVVEGVAERVSDRDLLHQFAQAVNIKYETDIADEFYDPDVNGCWRVPPRWVFSLTERNFTGSPTRWRFAE